MYACEGQFMTVLRVARPYLADSGLMSAQPTDEITMISACNGSVLPQYKCLAARASCDSFTVSLGSSTQGENFHCMDLKHCHDSM